MTDTEIDDEKDVATDTPNKLKPGRPPLYVFDKPDEQLSKNERRLKHAVMKRRLRQNRSYHRKKHLRQALSFIQQAGPRAPSKASDEVSVSQPLPVASINSGQASTHAPQELLSMSLPVPASEATYAPSSILHDLSSFANRPNESQDATNNFQVSVTVSSAPALVFPSTPSTSSRNALSPFASVHTDLADPLSPRSSPAIGTHESASQDCNSLMPPHFLSDEDRLVHDILDLTVSPTSATTPVSNSDCATSPISAVPLAPALQADFATRVSSLSSPSTDAMSRLALFPTTFSASSAVAVVNGLPQAEHSVDTVGVFVSDVLMPLVKAGLLNQNGQGRYAVSAVAKRLLPSPESSSSATVAMKNFVNHFRARLQALDPGTLSTGGGARLAAMLFYAEESQNVVAAIRFASQVSGPSGAFDVLCHAATVMRYCTAAEERVSVCSQALESIEGGRTHSTNSNSINGRDVDRVESEARVRLALGEAYLDMLVLDVASEHVVRAVSMLAESSLPADVCVSSVLALVLMAELRISQRAFAEGSRLLAEALNALSSAGLQRSTFAVCCLLSLGTVFTSMGQTEKALQSVVTALDVLSGLGYEHMPIYADGLRTLGSVHLAAGDADRAQKLFISALELIEKWVELNAPMQHCMHLDVFLMELLSETYEAQGRQEASRVMIHKAKQRRRERRLEDNDATNAAESSKRSRWILTRHLY